MISVAGPTRSSLIRDRRGAPEQRGGRNPSLEPWSAGVPFRLSCPWAQAGSLRFPGHPSYAFALFQDPGRAERTSSVTVLAVLPPGYPRRRPPHAHNLEADTWLQHPLSTLHERRCRRLCKTRFRLAGCAFAGRASNPLGDFKRFQDLHSILLFRACPDASRVGEDVAVLTPHRPGRAAFPHPVPHGRA